MRPAASLIRNVHRGGEILRCARETGQWRTITAAYLGLRNLTYPYSLELRDLQPLTVQEISDIWTFWQIFAREVYPLSGLESVIVDAGANVGFFTLFAARNCPQARVLAIEPSPETFGRLVENVEKNNFADRVRCLPICLAESEGVRQMKVVRSRSQLQRLLPLSSTDPGAIPVQAMTLGALLSEIPSVDLLKMDIEGGEYEVLLGAGMETLRKIRRLILEYHPDEGAPTELLTHLQLTGFRVKHNAHNTKGYGLATLERRDGNG